MLNLVINLVKVIIIEGLFCVEMVSRGVSLLDKGDYSGNKEEGDRFGPS